MSTLLTPPPAVETSPSDYPIVVPETAHKLDGFRAWAHSDDFPERGRIEFINGRIYIDMSREELETHNAVRGEIGRAITQIAKKTRSGWYLAHGVFVSNDEADVANNPDGVWVEWESIRTGRVTLIPRKDVDGEYIEMQGSPDCHIEIISRSSVPKDTVVLRNVYHRAKVREYWVVNARGETIDFTILHYREDGYIAAEPDSDGWLYSEVFNCRFRLTREKNPLDLWRYTLEVADA